MNGRRALKGGRLHVRQQVSTRLISRRHGMEQAGKGRRQIKGISFVELMCQVTWQITFCGRYRQCNICDISSEEVAGSCAQYYMLAILGDCQQPENALATLLSLIRSARTTERLVTAPRGDTYFNERPRGRRGEYSAR